MECISSKYNIYLTENNTLLFYDTLPNGELDKAKITIKNINEEILELVTVLSKNTSDENKKIVTRCEEIMKCISDFDTSLMVRFIFKFMTKD